MSAGGVCQLPKLRKDLVFYYEERTVTVRLREKLISATGERQRTHTGRGQSLV